MLTRIPVPDDIAEYLKYQPDTGDIVWIQKTSSASRVSIGSVAGGVNKTTGYRRIKFRDKKFAAHRLAFYLSDITIPAAMDVDHINGDKLDNRWCNLRLITRSENACNAKRHRQGRVPGVYYHSRQKKWRAYTMINGKQKHLGLFTTEADAIRSLDD